MRREEKRRRLNEAVVNMLFPHPPSPPQSQREEEEEEEKSEPGNIYREDFDVDLIPEESEQSGCSTSDDNGEGEGDGESGKKLTRAQRKRLRKKKLKEDASRRGNIIGPLLPPTSDASVAIETEPPSVRRNAADNKVEAKLDKSGENSGCASQKKLKHRRMAKRVAKDRLKSSTVENCSQNNA